MYAKIFERLRKSANGCGHIRTPQETPWVSAEIRWKSTRAHRNLRTSPGNGKKSVINLKKAGMHLTLGFLSSTTEFAMFQDIILSEN